MLLSDVATVILLENGKYLHYDDAKSAVFVTFKSEFPYWSYDDWNTEVSFKVAKTIAKVYEDSPNITIKELIVDLPPIVNIFGKR